MHRSPGWLGGLMRHSTDGEQHSVNQRGSRFLLLCYPADWASASHGPGMGHCPKLVCHPSLMTTECMYVPCFCNRGQGFCYLQMCQTREIPGQAAPKKGSSETRTGQGTLRGYRRRKPRDPIHVGLVTHRPSTQIHNPGPAVSAGKEGREGRGGAKSGARHKKNLGSKKKMVPATIRIVGLVNFSEST